MMTVTNDAELKIAIEYLEKLNNQTKITPDDYAGAHGALTDISDYFYELEKKSPTEIKAEQWADELKGLIDDKYVTAQRQERQAATKAAVSATSTPIRPEQPKQPTPTVEIPKSAAPQKIDLNKVLSDTETNLFAANPASQTPETKTTQSKPAAPSTIASNKEIKDMAFREFFAAREKFPNEWNNFKAKVESVHAEENIRFLEAHAEFLKNPTKEAYIALYNNYIDSRAPHQINLVENPIFPVKPPLENLMNPNTPYDSEKAKAALDKAVKHIEGILSTNYFTDFKQEQATAAANVKPVNPPVETAPKATASTRSEMEDAFTRLVKSGKALFRKQPSQKDNTTSDLIQTSKSFFENANKHANNQLKETRANSIENLIKSGAATREQIAEDAKNTHPIAHTETRQLIQDFLDHKRANGSEVEKKLYANMTPEAYLQERAIGKRPLMFMGAMDSYILRDGTNVPQGDSAGWQKVGTNQESGKLLLRDYNSYDEMQINALIGIRTPTHFINNGRRNNFAQKDIEGSYEKRGVLVGLVGCRFEKPGLMDYQHMVITREQNTVANGYGPNGDAQKAQNMAHFAKQYRQPHFPSFEEAEREYNANPNGKYLQITDKNGETMYFNKEVYKERMRMVIEPFLNDANQQAKEQGKMAYVHAVGLGLGAWAHINGVKCDNELGKLQVEVYNELLRNNTYPNIGNVNFSWFPDGAKGNLDNTKIGNTDIVFSKRNPADPLTGNDAGKLLVAQYAWDGNSAAHNEYWAGQLNNSGDPAAGCCSTSPELSNPDINKRLKTAECKLLGENRSEMKAEAVKSSGAKLSASTPTQSASHAADNIMKKGAPEFRQWANEEYNKPARPMQPLPLSKEDQKIIHDIELKTGKAMSDLRFAAKDTTNAAVMTQALKNVQTISTEINALKSVAKDDLMKEKLSHLDKGLHAYVQESQKKVGNEHIAKPEQSKPIESAPAAPKPPEPPARPQTKLPEQHITPHR